MPATMRRKPKKQYPPPPQKFTSLEEVSAWALKLYRAMTEARDESYGGKVLHSTAIPTTQDGRDGDIWIQHT
jgi:hypothetical protein